MIIAGILITFCVTTVSTLTLKKGNLMQYLVPCFIAGRKGNEKIVMTEGLLR